MLLCGCASKSLVYLPNIRILVIPKSSLQSNILSIPFCLDVPGFFGAHLTREDFGYAVLPRTDDDLSDKSGDLFPHRGNTLEYIIHHHPATLIPIPASST